MSETNDNNDNTSHESKVVFKKRSRFGQRRGRVDQKSDEEKEEECAEEWTKMNELKELQNQRKRSTRGVNILELSQTEAKTNSNANNCGKSETKSGGLTDAKTMANELDLGHTFSVETNRRDEDTDLMKYIDEELSKRKIRHDSEARSAAKGDEAVMSASTDLNDLLFNVLPEHLMRNNAKKSEEMLSNQMLNGIPEVELGVEERIRNIEATEEAKSQLLAARRSRSDANTSSFVPNNIAVCFVHHNRFTTGDAIPRVNNNAKRMRSEPQQQTQTYVEEPVVVIGDEPQKVLKLQTKGSEQHHNRFRGKDKASDDYIFEKFKKQFRKF